MRRFGNSACRSFAGKACFWWSHAVRVPILAVTCRQGPPKGQTPPSPTSTRPTPPNQNLSLLKNLPRFRTALSAAMCVASHVGPVVGLCQGHLPVRASSGDGPHYPHYSPAMRPTQRRESDVLNGQLPEPWESESWSLVKAHASSHHDHVTPGGHETQTERFFVKFILQR